MGWKIGIWALKIRMEMTLLFVRECDMNGVDGWYLGPEDRKVQASVIIVREHIVNDVDDQSLGPEDKSRGHCYF